MEEIWLPDTGYFVVIICPAKFNSPVLRVILILIEGLILGREVHNKGKIHSETGCQLITHALKYCM